MALETEIKTKKFSSDAYKFFIQKDGEEIARAFLYLMKNDLHPELVGYLEDVFVSESFRGQKIGTLLVQKVISQARESGCYKLVCSSRFSREGVHKWYESLGFSKTGYNFRMDF